MGNNSLVASILLTTSGTNSIHWTIDSSAFNHMTSNKTIFDSSRLVTYSPYIYIGNNSRMSATHIGYVSSS